MAYLWGKLCLYSGAFSGFICTFNPHPFAEGSTKQSHEGIYGEEAPKEKYGQTAVVKKLKNGLNKSPLSIKTQFNNDILTHKIAAEYASIWNGLNKENNSNINIQIPYITQINKTSTSKWFNTFSKYYHSDGEYILVEDYLHGNFEKFNSNTGWVKNNKSFINAFSHWTYHHSNGQYLVCDLQGVKNINNQYKLTDPVITSKNGNIFGNTDLGIVGISNWFYFHKCNQYCNKNWIK
eukprot:776405_1